MHSILFLGGWPDFGPPRTAWTGADAAGRALTLTALPELVEGKAPVVATNETKNVHAVLAGAVYNRRELAVALGGRHAFSSHEDAELVVHLYEERGVQCLKALRGGFALALWDARVGRLLIARDQLGVMPLYYAVDGMRLAVASALRTLVTLPKLADTYDAAALESLLTFGFVPPPATLYPGIRQLSPGEHGVWENGRLKVQRYWQLTFPERRLGLAEAAGVVREQTLESLRLRQAGATPGVLLSGGLDAAALLALASEDRHPPTRVYTAAVTGAEDGELAKAARLAARFGVDHVACEESPDWPAVLDGLLQTFGEPGASLDGVMLAIAGKRAALDGDVALAGIGAEPVFGGALAARRASRVARYGRLPSFARELTEMWARLGPARMTEDVRTMLDGVRLAPLELYARAVSRFWPEERDRVFTPETIASIGDAAPWRTLAAYFAAATDAGANDTPDAIHHVELSFRLPHLTAVTTAVTATGLELRLPFADHRLAQILASVPSTSRGGPRERQSWLRAAVGNSLPKNLLRTPHRPAAPPASAWTADGLRALAEELFAPHRVAADGVLHPDLVARCWQEHLDGTRDHSARLWTFALVIRWLERRRKRTATVSPAARTVLGLASSDR